MTPPHIEKAARFVDPHVFDDWLKNPPKKMKRWSSAEITNAQKSAQERAIRRATLVWNLARAATLEEAAKVAEGQSATFDFQRALADCRDSDYGRACAQKEAAAAIRALSVEQPRPSPSSEE